MSGRHRSVRSVAAVVATAALVCATATARASGWGAQGHAFLPLPPGVIAEAPTSAQVDGRGRLVIVGVEVVEAPRRPGVVVRRVLPSGVGDPSFGRLGQRTVAATLAPVAVAIARDGDIVVAGVAPVGTHGQDTIAVLRLRPDGSRDPAFGRGGLVRLPIPSGMFSAEPESVALTPAGGIVIAGHADLSPGSARLAVVRLSPSGRLDREFRGGGVDVFSQLDVDGAAVRVDPARRILIGSSGVSGERLAALRLTRRGRIDATFGDHGMAALLPHNPQLTASTSVCAILRDSAGRIVVVGTAYGTRPAATTANEFSLVRFDARGRVDRGFGDGGLTQTVFVPSPGPSMSDSIEQAASAFMRGDGRIVVGGSVDVFHSRGYDFGVAEYLPNGRLDPAFHDHGLLLADFHDNEDLDVSTRPLDPHHIVMVGRSWRPQIQLARIGDP